MNRKLAAVLLIACLMALLLTGCRDAAPMPVGTPTPAPTATPGPETYYREVTGDGPETDALGAYIASDEHYRMYLTFGEIVVYEYEEDTFLDGVIVNAYPEPIHTEIEIVYYDEDMRMIGRGMLKNAEGGYEFPSGSSRVYAEIATDVDVRLRDFTMEYRVLPEPVQEQIIGELTPVN